MIESYQSLFAAPARQDTAELTGLPQAAEEARP
jgi:hypothetical protein